jgi:hypothetical protein
VVQIHQTHVLCTSALRSSVTLLILDLTKTLRLCLRLRSLVNTGPDSYKNESHHVACQQK